MMDSLPWILLVVACPIGMLLIGAVAWVVAKGGGLFGRDSSKHADSPPEAKASG